VQNNHGDVSTVADGKCACGRLISRQTARRARVFLDAVGQLGVGGDDPHALRPASTRAREGRRTVRRVITLRSEAEVVGPGPGWWELGGQRAVTGLVLVDQGFARSLADSAEGQMVVTAIQS